MLAKTDGLSETQRSHAVQSPASAAPLTELRHPSVHDALAQYCVIDPTFDAIMKFFRKQCQIEGPGNRVTGFVLSGFSWKMAYGSLEGGRHDSDQRLEALMGQAGVFQAVTRNGFESMHAPAPSHGGLLGANVPPAAAAAASSQVRTTMMHTMLHRVLCAATYIDLAGDVRKSMGVANAFDDAGVPTAPFMEALVKKWTDAFPGVAHQTFPRPTCGVGKDGWSPVATVGVVIFTTNDAELRTQLGFSHAQLHNLFGAGRTKMLHRILRLLTMVSICLIPDLGQRRTVARSAQDAIGQQLFDDETVNKLVDPSDDALSNRLKVLVTAKIICSQTFALPLKKSSPGNWCDDCNAPFKAGSSYRGCKHGSGHGGVAPSKRALNYHQKDGFEGSVERVLELGMLARCVGLSVHLFASCPNLVLASSMF